VKSAQVMVIEIDIVVLLPSR